MRNTALYTYINVCMYIQACAPTLDATAPTVFIARLLNSLSRSARPHMYIKLQSACAYLGLPFVTTSSTDHHIVLNPLSGQWLLYVPPGLTMKVLHFSQGQCYSSGPDVCRIYRVQTCHFTHSNQLYQFYTTHLMGKTARKWQTHCSQRR